MRAKSVYENLDFERGIEPRDAMKIGLTPEIKIHSGVYIIHSGDHYSPWFGRTILSDEEIIEILSNPINYYWNNKKRSRRIWFETNDKGNFSLDFIVSIANAYNVIEYRSKLYFIEDEDKIKGAFIPR